MSAGLRTVVVDDEPAAVRALVRLLKETGRVEVVGTAPGADEALALPGWAEVDVAFLDIVMPGMTGIELARRLPGNPLVVFVTGYDGYAEQAFRVNAVDFLRKPVAQAQLEETLDRLEGRVADSTRVGARVLSPALFRDRNVRVEREGVMAGSRSAGSGQEGQEVAESGKAGAQK